MSESLCPYCEGPVSETAAKCRHCGEWLTAEPAAPPKGSAGNVVAALASFFVPGLGQLAQGRFLAGLFVFLLAVVLWFVYLGWVIHLLAALDAAAYGPKQARRPTAPRARRRGLQSHQKGSVAALTVVAGILVYAVVVDSRRPSSPRPAAVAPAAVSETATLGPSIGERRWAQVAANVRSAPGTSSGIVNQLSAGQPVLVGAPDGAGWAPVLTPGADTLGYVFAQLLGDSIAAPRPAARSPQLRASGRLVVCDGGTPVGAVNLWDSPQRQRATSRVPTGSSCQGPRIEILAQRSGRCSGDCVRIRVVESGATGWVSEIFVER